MELRPHHAMCVLNYVGKGYDDDFSKNMTSIVGALCPDTDITLISRADALCRACPNRRDVTPDDPVGCTSPQKVARYDARLLEEVGLNQGMSIKFGELSKRVKETVFTDKAAFDAVCGDCEWHELCTAVRFGKQI